MSRLRMGITSDDHFLGSRDAPIILVEYGDYECPFCGQAYWEVQRVRRALGDRLGYAFRNFPLAQVHMHAVQAAEAAESAGAQGRFWEMHSLLFEHQQDLEIPTLLAYARALGLDVGRFAEDMEEHRHMPRIQRDFMSGVRSGVNGTPCLFINGVRHEGSFAARELISAAEAMEGQGDARL
jgi:protein-disulfide isomerase